MPVAKAPAEVIHRPLLARGRRLVRDAGSCGTRCTDVQVAQADRQPDTRRSVQMAEVSTPRSGAVVHRQVRGAQATRSRAQPRRVPGASSASSSHILFVRAAPDVLRCSLPYAAAHRPVPRRGWRTLAQPERSSQGLGGSQAGPPARPRSTRGSAACTTASCGRRPRRLIAS